MDKLLNKKDIENIVGEPLIFYKNEDLKFIKNVDDLFQGRDKVLLLYVGDDRIGHWTALKKYRNTIMYFDSFGDFPDKHLKDIPKKNHAELCRILYNANNYKLEYNDKKLQSEYANTCGRWCAYFLLHCTNVDDFSKVFNDLKKKVNLDELVYYLTI